MIAGRTDRPRAFGRARTSLRKETCSGSSCPVRSAEELSGLARSAGAAAEQIALPLANPRPRDALRAQAIRDPLTGLFNRRSLQVTHEREIKRAERRGSSLSFVMFDIDHFKRFNDTCGHGAGDVLLREMGAYLCAGVRTEDVPCRYGGEELALILPHTPL